MAQTDVDICNLAIGRVGADAIEALDEESPVAAFCAVNYAQKRDWLLSGHRWVFANRTVSLARLTTTPADCPRAYGFQRPGDVIGAIHAYRRGPRDADRAVDVVQAGQLLASDEATVWAEYTARVAEAQWPAWFVELVRVAFAADLAMHLQNRSLSAQLNEEAFGPPALMGAGGLLLAAMQADGRNAPPRQLFYDDPGPLVGARFSSGFYGATIGGFIDFGG